MEHLQGGIYHQVFQPDFADRFLFAASCALGIGALVIAVDNLVPAGAALTKHHGPAHPAEQFGCEQVVILCFVPGWGPTIFGNLFLNTVEQFLLNDNRNRIRHHNVLKPVFSDVTSVGQQGLDAVIGEFLIAVGCHALAVEPVHDPFHGGAFGIALEGFHHKGSFQRVNLKKAILINHISDRDGTAIVLPFQDVLCHAAHHLFGQLSRVILSHAGQHTFHHDTGGTVRNGLGSRHQLYMIPLENVLVVGCVIPVPGEAVQFPDQDHIKQSPLAVLDHPLKLRTICGLG